MLRVFEAFAGYGSQSIALRNLGIEHEVVAISEIDKYAIQAYEAIHEPTNNLGDISKIDSKDIPEHDLFTYSFPCQDISVAGKTKGIVKGETRSGLLYECEKIIEAKRPKYLLMENVKNLVGEKFKPQFDEWLEYLEGLRYTNYWQVLNAKHYGVPQNRERVFVVSILGEHKPYKFPKAIPLDKCIADILEVNVDEKYYLSEEVQNKFKPNALTNANESGPKRLGGCFDTDKSKHQAGSVGDKNKISPAIDTMQGGYRQPLIKIEKVGNLECEGWHEIETRVPSIEGLSPTVETRNRAKFILPCIAASRGRNPDNPSSREAGEPTEQRLEFNTKGTSNTITTVQKDNYVVEQTYRIRKLTPRECFRLMGLHDDDIDKIQATGISNTQQYKMAGNSIVINVLEAIFKNLFKGE